MSEAPASFQSAMKGYSVTLVMDGVRCRSEYSPGTDEMSFYIPENRRCDIEFRHNEGRKFEPTRCGVDGKPASHTVGSVGVEHIFLAPCALPYPAAGRLVSCRLEDGVMGRAFRARIFLDSVTARVGDYELSPHSGLVARIGEVDTKTRTVVFHVSRAGGYVHLQRTDGTPFRVVHYFLDGEDVSSARGNFVGCLLPVTASQIEERGTTFVLALEHKVGSSLDTIVSPLVVRLVADPGPAEPRAAPEIASEGAVHFGPHFAATLLVGGKPVRGGKTLRADAHAARAQWRVNHGDAFKIKLTAPPDALFRISSVTTRYGLGAIRVSGALLFLREIVLDGTAPSIKEMRAGDVQEVTLDIVIYRKGHGNTVECATLPEEGVCFYGLNSYVRDNHCEHVVGCVGCVTLHVCVEAQDPDRREQSMTERVQQGLEEARAELAEAERDLENTRAGAAQWCKWLRDLEQNRAVCAAAVERFQKILGE